MGSIGNKNAFGSKHPHTQEHKDKIVKSLKGNKRGLGNKANLGKKQTEKQIKEKSERYKKLGIHPPIMFGENNHAWKGGITPIVIKIRTSPEYIFWRKSILLNYNFTCQKTGQQGGKLVVHHINNFADFPELRFNIDNGIVLSEDTHKEFHKKYGKSNNTREQIEEFLGKKLCTV